MTTKAAPSFDPIAALLEALRDERVALEADDVARLPAIAALKNDLLQACAELITRGIPPARKAAVRAGLAQARTMNSHNALLLQPRLNLVKGRLAVLMRRNDSAQATVYGSDGMARSGFGMRRGFAT